MKRRELYLVSDHIVVSALLNECYDLDATTPWFRGRKDHQLKLAQTKDRMWDAIMDVHFSVTGLINTKVDIRIRELKGFGMCFIVAYDVDDVDDV